MSDTITIQRFHPAQATRAEWSAWHVFRHIRAAAVNPDDPLLTDAEAEAEDLKSNPLWDHHWFLARDGETVVGTAGFGFRRPESADAAIHAPFLGGGGYVLHSHRRRGIGSALLQQARAMMHAMDKTTLSLSTHTDPGHAFLTRIGAIQKHSGLQNRARFADLDWAQLRAWEDGIADAGLTWERHALRVAEPTLTALLPDFTRLIADMPMGGLDRPPIRFEIEGYRQWYETLDRVGGAHHILVLRDPTGHVAGLTEVGWDSRTPDRAFQQLTATDRAWRGRGLARALKAAMFRQIRDHHPEVALMITGNAEVNAPMLSINRRVGFKVHRRTVDYQITRDALDAWSALAR